MHAVATSILTLAELSHYRGCSIELALRALSWANKTMRSPKGWYYYQKKKFWTVRIPYMRWTQAWMLDALVSLAATQVESQTRDVVGP